MSVEVFLDTNIYLYAASSVASESEKQRRASELIKQNNFGLSTQVMQEFYYNATVKSKKPMSALGALAWLEQFDDLPCVATDRHLVKTAIALSIRYKISYWDGAILAAAEKLGAKIVYTEDLNHGQRYGTVTVINPFRP